MQSNEQEPDLSKCAMEMNIWSATFSSSDHAEKGSRLRHSGDSVVEEISNALEFEGRMTKGSFEKMLERARNSNEEIQLQLSFARESKIGDEQTLERTEHLSTDIAHRLDRLIRSSGLEAGS